jgi:hypothetical protein
MIESRMSIPGIDVQLPVAARTRAQARRHRAEMQEVPDEGEDERTPFNRPCTTEPGQKPPGTPRAVDRL